MIDEILAHIKQRKEAYKSDSASIVSESVIYELGKVEDMLIAYKRGYRE